MVSHVNNLVQSGSATENSAWLQRKNISGGATTEMSKKGNKGTTNPRGSAFCADEEILHWQASSHPALLLHSLLRFSFFPQWPLNLSFSSFLVSHTSLSLSIDIDISHFSLFHCSCLSFSFIFLHSLSLWLHPSSFSTLTVIPYLRAAWQANAQSGPLVPFPQQRSSSLHCG